MSKLFGTDGVRGIANKELTIELATKIGIAAANVLTEENKELTILIGSDTRLSSSMLIAAVASGLCSNGANVINLGVVPTPAVSYLVKKYKADAGIMISASHNSFEYNGIKIFDQNGLKLPDLIEEEIEKIIEDGIINNIDDKKIGIIENNFNAYNEYINYLLTTVNNITDMKVVFDLANGSSCITAPTLFSKVLKNPIFIANEPNGININEECGSTHLDNLINYVKENKMDLGIAFDGDADRCMFIDSEGNIIDGDYVLAMTALNMKKHKNLKKNTVVGTILSNLGLVKFCEENNFNFVATKVGDRYVLEEMLLKDYNIGGEQSGHIIFKDYMNTGDGELTALQILQILSDENKSLNEYSKIMKKYPQVTKNITVKPEEKKDFFLDKDIEKAIKIAKEKLQDNGRIVVRPSGTEPLIRVMLEGQNIEEITNILNQVSSVIENKIGITKHK